jgi:hypothetical protein
MLTNVFYFLCSGQTAMPINEDFGANPKEPEEEIPIPAGSVGIVGTGIINGSEVVDDEEHLSPMQKAIQDAEENAIARLKQRKVLTEMFRKRGAPTLFPVGFAEGYSQAYRLGYNDFLSWR